MSIFSRKRRGALDLSLTTIVILIFAITVLGLGLALISSLFQEARNKMYQALTNTEIKIPPTAESPFTVSNDQLTLQRGKKSTPIQIAVFNVGTEPSGYKMETLGECANSGLFTLTPSNDKVIIRDINQQGIDGWQLVVRVGTSTPNGDYSCSVHVFSVDGNGNPNKIYNYNRDFFIEVQ